MARTKSRPSKIGTVIVPVADQRRMTAFYCDTLGFEPRVDLPFGPDGQRWVEVGLGEESTTVALAPPAPGMSTGNHATGISLQVDDIEAYHAQLREAGADVDAEILRAGEPVPPMFWLRDPEGNVLLVVQ